MSEEGFAKSYRSKWENPVFRNLLEAGIWAWMCDTAVWKETKIRFNGELITLQRGQLVTSVRFISKGFCIGEQVTRTFLENIENDEMANTRPTHRGTLITICNYDKYQTKENAANTQGNTRPTHAQHTANTNKKEDKNLRSKEKEERKKVVGARFALQDPPVEWIAYCEMQRPELNAREVFAGFRDYWIAKAGKDGVKLDWLATWRNWIRNQKSPSDASGKRKIIKFADQNYTEGTDGFIVS